MNDTTAIRIVEAIAEQKDIEPTELDYRLNDYIETDAIQSLANSDTDAWTLSFECPDGTVTVTGQEGVHLDFGDQPGSTTRRAAVD